MYERYSTAVKKINEFPLTVPATIWRQEMLYVLDHYFMSNIISA